ncbi:MAG: NAD(P)H-dependent oxidoreductase [Thermanaerothrix sp.]|uniref:NAD(P)H-dependent oxidoreductase n=1 Tax=Thermanaerothrix sp. TaxID=2972675 RepID=UPI003C7AF935
MSLSERLQERATSVGPIKVALVGAGQMGTGLISQTEKMVGIKVVAVADIIPNRALEAFLESGVSIEDVVEVVDDPDKASDIILTGKRVVTTNAEILPFIKDIDVVVECTGIPEVGAQVCFNAIQAGKHVVNMNVETDATVGYVLSRRAQDRGVIYTLVAGDEPGAIKELYDFAEVLGFEVISVGKGKNNPLDRTANPKTVEQRAREQMMNPKMLASFVDGTKTMVELTSIGNAIGFAPEVPGCYGPTCSVKELPYVFVPKFAGGIFEGIKTVDYAVGDVAPGVFVVITTDQPKIIRDLRYLRLLGNEKHNYWVLYRPYHLANLEAPISIARTVIYQEPTLATMQIPVAETVAYAKKDLKPGDIVDALGGFTVYGLIVRADYAYENKLVPLGISVGGIIKKAIKRGEPIRYEDIQIKEDQLIYRLRLEQDSLIKGKICLA